MGPDGDLGAAAGLPGHGLDDHGAVGDLRDLQLEQALHQTGMGPGQHDLRALSAPADLHHIDADMVALADLLPGDLLVFHEGGFGMLPAAAQLQNGAAIAGIHPQNGAGDDLVLLGGVFIGDHPPLGLPDALDDDLLGRGGGDAAKILGVDVDADLVPQLGRGGIGPGLLQGHFGGGVLHILHHGLDGVHGDGPGLLVDVDEDVVQSGALGVALVQGLVGGHQRLGDPVQHIILPDALFLFQVLQGLDHLACHGSFLSPGGKRPRDALF